MRGVAALALAVAVALVLGGCSDDGDDAAPATTATTASSTTAPPTRSKLTRLPLDVDRLGPITIGMTPAEAEEAGGVPLHEDQLHEDIPCVMLWPEDGEGVELYALDGRIAFINVGAPVKTAAGIGAGATRDDIEAAYPGASLEGRLNRFGHRELVVTPPGVTDKHFVFIFATDNLHVDRVRTGLVPAVDDHDEGCA